MGWYPCGCCGGGGEGDPCDHCTTTSDTVQIEISGIGEDVCSACTDLNGTYALAQDGIEYCVWTATQCFLYCPSGYSMKVTFGLEARPLTPSANVGWRLTVTMQIYSNTTCSGSPYAESLVIYQWSSGGTADFDCTATRTATLFLETPDPTYGEPCDLSTWTVTINP